MHIETAVSIDYVLLLAMTLYFVVRVIVWVRRRNK